MSLFKEKRPFFVKLFMVSISVAIAAVVAQMIIAVFVAILGVPFVSSLPSFISAIIFFYRSQFSNIFKHFML